MFIYRQLCNVLALHAILLILAADFYLLTPLVVTALEAVPVRAAVQLGARLVFRAVTTVCLITVAPILMFVAPTFAFLMLHMDKGSVPSDFVQNFLLMGSVPDDFLQSLQDAMGNFTL